MTVCRREEDSGCQAECNKAGRPTDSGKDGETKGLSHVQKPRRIEYLNTCEYLNFFCSLFNAWQNAYIGNMHKSG